MASTSPQPYGGNNNSVAASDRYNVLAIVGFILAFIVSIAGLIVSIIALRQIARTGERGHGLALAGVILGAVFLVLGIVFSIVGVIAASQISTSTTY